jgi:outer membrane scaffolding protein for murein synthesis (MipA/OmpV family)
MRFALAGELKIDMKKLLFLIFFASGPCFAQTQSANTMPDGSQDQYIGIGVDVTPVYEGSSHSETHLFIKSQIEWSNGVYLTNSLDTPERGYLQVGKHLSQTPEFDYGPLITLSQSRPTFRLDHPVTQGTSTNMVSIGGFFKYNLLDDLQLTSNLQLYVGKFSGGARADFDVRKYMHIAPHHSIMLWSGLTWGNRDFAQSQYGVTSDQALTSGFSSYSPTAGVEDVHLGLNWRWELSGSWMLNSGLYATHLTGSVAGSPQIEKPNNASVSIGLVYRL